MSIAVSFDKVSIVFGDRPQTALPLMDEGRSREEIQAATGQVLGVHDCSLDVGEGEILVLMGLSGSGKSTLLRAVNGLNPVTRGAVRVQDAGGGMVDIARASAAQLRALRLSRVSMVFQQFGLLPWRSVRDNVGLGLELAGMGGAERARRIDEQLELVGLSDWAARKVGELSGGMQQRVGLARAFATQAPILLMDEPFSALDPLIRTRLQDELLSLQERLKRTIIFVSHDLDEAFKLGDRIAIMEGGRIVQCGTPRDIFSDPANDYVADFVANMNPLGVLQARDVMIPLTGDSSGAGGAGAEPGKRTGKGRDAASDAGQAKASTLAADAPLGEAMRALMATPGALRVVEDGAVIGEITAASVMAMLCDPGAASGGAAADRTADRTA